MVPSPPTNCASGLPKAGPTRKPRPRAEGAAQWQPLAQFLEFAYAVAGPPPRWPSPGPISMPPAPPRTNSLATASLIMGLFSMTCGLCCCYGFPFNVLGLIFALAAFAQIRRDPLGQQGKGLAIAGLVLCLLSLVSAALFLTLGLALNLPERHRRNFGGFSMSAPPVRSPATQPLVLAAVMLPVAVAVAVLFCFDPCRYPFYPICYFHRTTGLLCAGCGSLRALHQLLHGHLVTAFRFNPLVVLSLPLMLGFGARYAAQMAKSQPASLGFRPIWLWLVLATVIAFTVVRNVPGLPFATLPQ